MGLFDKIIGGAAGDRLLNVEEAFAAVLLVAVAADGHVSDEEKREFAAIVNRVQLYRAMNGDQFSAMMDKLHGLHRREGSERLIERAAQSLPSELRETVFALAADLVLADGSVEADEKTLLELLQSRLGIGDGLALRVVEVLAIKNRG
ncbi:MAG: tellurite resistance TerB family protein [Opitutae bacterium]|nr:tellurite resistance TerB family protein [Opitutae bacterium]